MVKKPLEMSPDLQKFWGKKTRKNQPFLREKMGTGQYFLRTWYLLGTFIGLLSKSAAAHPYQKPKLSTPWGL